METRAAIVYGPNDIRLEQKNIQCGPDEVLVKNIAMGICGSDKNIFSGRLPTHTTEFRHPPMFPFPLGHESGGYVTEVGDRTGTFSIGDRVISFGWNNNFADYFVAKEWQLQPAPEEFEDNETALGEPKACAVFSAMNSRISLGDTVAVIGCGFAGQIILQCAKKMGAFRTVAVDPSLPKLEIARIMGADILLNPSEDDVSGAIRDLTGGKGIDVAVEAAGSETSMNMVTDITARNGKIVLYSWITQPVNLNISRWHDDGIEIITTCLVHHTWQERYIWAQKALRPVAQGQIDIKPLIGKTFRLDNIQQAFEEADNDSKGSMIKTLIKP